MDSADAFVVVYSIVSQRSFDVAVELCLKLESKFPEIPLLLLANCCDLNYAREVDAEEGISDRSPVLNQEGDIMLK